MQRRKLLAALCGILVAGSARPKLVFGQASQKHALVIWVAAYPLLTGREDLHFKTSFLEGMSEFGYTEGSNLAFEFMAGSGPSDLPRLAEQAIAAQPAVLLAPATLEAVALSRATSKIPIVCPALADAVHLGLINSDARPGRNVTGIEPYIAGLPAKQIDLARELVPRAARVGLLTNDADPKGPPQTRELTSVLAEMGLSAVSVNADKSSEIGAALERLASEKVDVVVVLQTNLLLGRRFNIAEAALEKGIPTVYGYRENVIAGGLASYGVDLRSMYHRAAYFVDRILKGSNPGDLPIEFPTNFLLTTNVRTAKSLGITLPPALLARADEVIE